MSEDTVVTWNKRLLACLTQAGIFLQTWEWGEFQRRLGRSVLHLRDVEIIVMPLPLGKKYWYVPRSSVDAALVSTLSREAAGQATFLRFEPVTLGAFPFTDGFLPGAKRIKTRQPQRTLVTHLQSDEKLLGAMHQKTRYNIRLAERNGVAVKIDRASVEHFRVLWSQFLETAERNDFRLHPRSYYEHMVEAVPSNEVHMEIATAVYEHHIVASALLLGFGDTLTYVHGASSRAYRQVMGPHLLHFRIMQWARLQGYKHYDWWGIGRDHGAADPLAGVGRFKLGFGGEIVEYPPAFDVPLDRLGYMAYVGGQRLKKFVKWGRR